MKKHIFILSIGLILSLYLGYAQAPNCKIKNTAFKSGEKLSYVISYNWFVVFSEVGLVDFTIKNDTIDGQKAYHFIGEGKTFNWWDSFFEVRDVYESWVRRDDLSPLFFQRNNKEGKFSQNESYIFKDDSVVYRKNRTYDHPFEYDTIPTPPCTFDVLSSLLYTRNIDFSKIKKNDRIPVSVVLDDEVYSLYFRYLGIEDKKVKGLGTFECLKFTVLLVEGTMFHEGEDMFLWITNDKNHIPVFVESPILIGSIKARLTNIEGNRHRLSSKKE